MIYKKDKKSQNDPPGSRIHYKLYPSQLRLNYRAKTPDGQPNSAISKQRINFLVSIFATRHSLFEIECDSTTG